MAAQPTFPFPHNPGEGFVTGKVQQKMDVIRHQYSQVAIPNAPVVTIANRFDDDRTDNRVAKMIGSSRCSADGYEEIGFRPDPIRGHMIQSFFWR